MGNVAITCCIILEALYFFIGTKAIKPNLKYNSLLFIGIVAANLSIGYVLSANIFRYILFIVTIYLMIDFVLSKERFKSIYDIFSISIIVLFKFILELIAFWLIMGGEYSIIEADIFLFSFCCIIFTLRNYIFRLHSLMVANWKRSEGFYLRYVLLSICIGLVFLTLTMIFNGVVM